jgi:hypothetical protein
VDGHEVEVVRKASSGDEAVELACELGPEVILMDIKMPDKNGIKATREILRTKRGVGVLFGLLALRRDGGGAYHCDGNQESNDHRREEEARRVEPQDTHCSDNGEERARVLDFADLEVHALKALEREEVRSYYGERWRAFLVDEFQDTNPVQAELLDRLTQGTKLTVVGDEKQSIYGFRRADVEVFRRFRERILSEGGSEVLLATSFRSHSGLVKILNAVFSFVLGKLRQDLEAHREPRGRAQPARRHRFGGSTPSNATTGR